ncbi:hypothetical protein [Croceimicrobium sp.]|uniref:hypothetical protein n=1 Tax=Croceimicrobium sp. TaxID=2828340 RepID=UPI003BA9A2E7
MRKSLLHFFSTLSLTLVGFISISSCSFGAVEPKIDREKRDQLIERYDLLNFPNIQQPILLTIDEFFDGNNDVASIAPNLDTKPAIKEYFRTLKIIADNPKTTAAYVKIKDVLVNTDGQLMDDAWLYTDMIYFIGDLSREDIIKATKSLKPDEVEYDPENEIRVLRDEYKDKKIVYLWWD